MADGLNDTKGSSVAGDAAVSRLFAGGTVLCDGVDEIDVIADDLAGGVRCRSDSEWRSRSRPSRPR